MSSMGRVYGDADENWAPIPCGIGAQSVVLRGQAPVLGRPGLTGFGVTVVVGVGVGVTDGETGGVGVGVSHTG